jgi:uncharacterized Ntn-hydrolase superfamily protein
VTLSIVAFNDGLVGAAVTSCVIAAARRVIHIDHRSGACVTQASSDITTGEAVLAIMRAGTGADRALDDFRRADVQIAAVDFTGQIGVFTGADCDPYAGHHQVRTVSAQANTAALPDAWERMIRAYEHSIGQPLAERLVAALGASGGDARGQQAAGVIVTSTDPYNGDATEPHVDLRVDDHRNPVDELARLLSLHRAHTAVRRAEPDNIIETAARWLPSHPNDPYLQAAARA